MLRIKKIDLFVLKSFTLIFIGSFFICLFIFMMQFLWRYLDELVGKGLSLDVLAQFLWYASLTLAPNALPLALLLGSLITFGNLGERMELTAMKSAGIPLLRVMRPLVVLTICLCFTSFIFQNNIGPYARKQLSTLLYSIKTTSPALEIPEGIFYNGVPNINIYVKKKEPETGMLYGLIIYKLDQGFDRAQIVLADSGRLEMTADKHFLKLSMFQGEQFENLEDQRDFDRLQTHQPYGRETFYFKQILIAFDANFDLLDANALGGMAQAKNMQQLVRGIDSMTVKLDSVGRAYYRDAKSTHYVMGKIPPKDSIQINQVVQRTSIDFDTLFAGLPVEKQQSTLQAARDEVNNVRMELDWKQYLTKGLGLDIRKHQIEWHQKITLSLSCILFFLIGAPLGAIIRKGGLGFPTIVSVFIFIVYYIINVSGMKLAKDGSLNMFAGMWGSTFILTPVAFFLTYKANNDSVVFNMDLYRAAFRRLFGLRSERHLSFKEVIIYDPNYDQISKQLEALSSSCKAYNQARKLLHAPHYIRLFFRHQRDVRVEQISEELESCVEELSNTRDRKILNELNHYPIMFSRAHLSPFQRKWVNVAVGVVFPLGLFFWLRAWRFRLRLFRDLRQIVNSNKVICERIKELNQ